MASEIIFLVRNDSENSPMVLAKNLLNELVEKEDISFYYEDGECGIRETPLSDVLADVEKRAAERNKKADDVYAELCKAQSEGKNLSQVAHIINRLNNYISDDFSVLYSEFYLLFDSYGDGTHDISDAIENVGDYTAISVCVNI
jgi:hypothetical protein